MAGPGGGLRLVVVEPAELQLAPGVEVAGVGAGGVLALAQVRGGGHQRPEVDAVVAAAGAVQVGQAEVVAELVGEQADAAVLARLDVVVDVQAGVADRRAADLVAGRADLAGRVREGPAAVRPQRVGALRAAAPGLVGAGVHDDDVVQVAVGLGELAVLVVVVAVVDVVLGQLGLDVRGRAALGDLAVVPGLDGVPDELLALGPGAGALRALVGAVAGLVPRHGDPVADGALDVVPAGGLGAVEVAHRDRAGRVVEEHLLVVLPVEVLVPERVVVALAGLRDGVVRRAGGAPVARLAVVQRGVVHLVAELGEDHEDLVLALLRELDVVVADPHLGGCPAVRGLGHGALVELFQCLGAQRLALALLGRERRRRGFEAAGLGAVAGLGGDGGCGRGGSGLGGGTEQGDRYRARGERGRERRGQSAQLTCPFRTVGGRASAGNISHVMGHTEEI